MQRQTQEVLALQIEEMLSAGQTPMTDSVMRNPVTDYIDHDHFGREKSELFLRFPIVVGHSSSCAEPKDFIAEDIAGVPVLVVRQSDRSLKAFFNVCRHRGSKVTFEACGNRATFACRYHGWTYRSDGTLVNVTAADDFGDIDKAEMGLVELPVEERHGLIWVMLQAGSTIDVAAHLGPEFDSELTAYGMDDFVVDRSASTPAVANWKIIVDGFLEVYHLAFLHRTTIGPHIRSNFAPFRPLGLHGCMTAVRTNFDAVRGTIRNGGIDDVNLQPYLINAYQIFPNTVLVWSGRHFEAWMVFPDASDPSRSVTKVSVLGRRSEIADTGYWERNWVVVKDTVLTEDMTVGQSIQQGFTTGAQTEVTFGRNEPGVQHYHRSLAQAVGGAV